MAGLLDYFNRGTSALTGSTGNYGGLLSDEEQKAAQQQAQLAMAAQLLDAGGWSPNRTSFGQALGRGIAASGQARQSSVDQSLQAALLRKQLASAQSKQSPFGTVDVSKFTPESVAKFEQSGKHSDLVPVVKTGDGVGDYQPGDYTPDSWAKFAATGFKEPSLLARYTTPRQEYSPSFQSVTRTLKDGSTQMGSFDTRTNTYHWSGDVVGPGKKQEAEAAGTERGKTLATAEADLPRIEDNADQMVKTLDDFEKHPGFKYVFGWDSMAPTIPGSTQAGAIAYYDQIKGKTFLEAFNSLKGAGQITEIEGTKATDAIARLNRAQSEKDAKVALADLREVVEAARTRAQKKAGKQSSESEKPKRVKVDAQGNVIGN